MTSKRPVAQAFQPVIPLSLPPGVLFVLGSMFVAESPRWLYARGKKERAYAALLRSRSLEQADIELKEMEETALAKSTAVFGKQIVSGKQIKESLLRRKYVVPFVLACVILFCNTATGINSVIAYNTNILLQSGLSDLNAHWGYVIFTCVNFLMTICGMMLIDRKGRKFLFMMGTAGVTISMICVGLMFISTERSNLDTRDVVQSIVSSDQTLTLSFTPAEAKQLLEAKGYQGSEINSNRASLAVIYSYGDFTAATSIVRSDDQGGAPIHITRENCVPNNKVEAFFKNPFGNLDAARTAPLKIERASIGRVPEAAHGWLVALGLYIFVGFYATGPGVAVWLALSELMPTRIRSNGMSIALVLNQLVSTTLAGIFLPVASKYGYSAMFFIFASFTVIYFITVTFFLPETKGKTLEEIEKHFEGAAA